MALDTKSFPPCNFLVSFTTDIVYLGTFEKQLDLAAFKLCLLEFDENLLSVSHIRFKILSLRSVWGLFRGPAAVSWSLGSEVAWCKVTALDCEATGCVMDLGSCLLSYTELNCRKTDIKLIRTFLVSEYVERSSLSRAMCWLVPLAPAGAGHFLCLCRKKNHHREHEGRFLRAQRIPRWHPMRGKDSQ